MQNTYAVAACIILMLGGTQIAVAGKLTSEGERF